MKESNFFSKIKNRNNILKKVIIGLCAGIVTGLFGSGGGMVLVPAFTLILKLKEKEARATSIFCILPLVCISGIFYLKASYIEWQTSMLCAVRWCDRCFFWL